MQNYSGTLDIYPLGPRRFLFPRTLPEASARGLLNRHFGSQHSAAPSAGLVGRVYQTLDHHRRPCDRCPPSPWRRRLVSLPPSPAASRAEARLGARTTLTLGQALLSPALPRTPSSALPSTATSASSRVRRGRPLLPPPPTFPISVLINFSFDLVWAVLFHPQR